MWGHSGQWLLSCLYRPAVGHLMFILNSLWEESLSPSFQSGSLNNTAGFTLMGGPGILGTWQCIKVALTWLCSINYAALLPVTSPTVILHKCILPYTILIISNPKHPHCGSLIWRCMNRKLMLYLLSIWVTIASPFSWDLLTWVCRIHNRAAIPLVSVYTHAVSV